MAITPQAIKDQEFQTKFRGYDTIEVKAYLELVAEEFFELLERVRLQEEEIAELTQKKDLLQEVNERLEADIEAAAARTEELRQELAEKEENIAEQAKEIDELQVAQADFEVERNEFEEEISAAEGRVSDIEEKLRDVRLEADGMRNKIQMLEEQNRELKNGEVDFKRTIGAAQQFADSLKKNAREEAQKLQQESEAKASSMLQAAREEIEQLRQSAFAELSRLPREIEELSSQKRKVREELRELLAGYLEKVESFAGSDEQVKHYDYDELFQKIEIPDEPAAYGVYEETEEVAAALEAEEIEEEQRDELDDIDMELPLPEDLNLDRNSSDEEEDDLRNKLEEGGIAFLSDG